MSPRHSLGFRQWTAYGLLAIGVLGAGYMLLPRKATESPASLVSAETPSAAATTPLVQIRVSTFPADALLTLDNAAPMQAPLVITRAREKLKHRLRVSRPGYQDEERDLIFDASTELLVELNPIPTPESPQDQRLKSPETRVAKPSTTATGTRPSLPATTRGSEPASSRTRKPNRPLDPINPFSEP